MEQPEFDYPFFAHFAQKGLNLHRAKLPPSFPKSDFQQNIFKEMTCLMIRMTWARRAMTCLMIKKIRLVVGITSLNDEA